MSGALYVEKDCTIEHAGRTFEAGGAYVSDEHVIGYLSAVSTRQYAGAPVTITNWHGDQILGHGTITAVWRTPRSFVSSHMMQIRARIGDVWYTGRSAGNGMIWKGRREARQ